MRVTNNNMYNNFSTGINDIHSRLNKSMNKVATGKAYDSASDNPLAYYEGRKIDQQYQDALGKLDLIGDVKNRLYQQELGAKTIQKTLSDAKTKLQYIKSADHSGNMDNVKTVRDDLLKKQQAMVDALNSQYQNYYVFGGSDTTTPPFKMSEDGMTLTFTHTFPGDTSPTTIDMKMEKKADGSYGYNISDDDLKKIEQSMREQGRVDIGYGNINNVDSLLDTFTGGMNLLTGLNSDSVKAGVPLGTIRSELDDNPIAQLSKAILEMNDYIDGGDKGVFTDAIGGILDSVTDTEHTISTVYSDLGTKYSLVETTEDKLTNLKVALTEQYTDKMGADPYESVMEMYNNQAAYNAAQKLSSSILQSSIFDFMR